MKGKVIKKIIITSIVGCVVPLGFAQAANTAAQLPTFDRVTGIAPYFHPSGEGQSFQFAYLVY
jgi:hypothetical protein